MQFLETKIDGVYLLQLALLEDERGYFARTYCANEFLKRGLDANYVQCNTSFNRKKGTLRGMHYQKAPHGEAKLIRCTRGAIYDVVVDLRPDSKSYKQWEAFELSEANGKLLYVPEGCAHGFQTLKDSTEVFYQMSYHFVPEAARGLRWNDPSFKIEWPADERIISAKDQNYPDFIV